MERIDTKLIELLRELSACHSVVGDGEDGDETGWVYDAAQEYPNTTWKELWEDACHQHIQDAWWLAARLGSGQDQLRAAVRRALIYAFCECETAKVNSMPILKAASEQSMSSWRMAAELTHVASSGYSSTKEADDTTRYAVEAASALEHLEKSVKSLSGGLKGIEAARHASTVSAAVIQAANVRGGNRLLGELQIQSDALLDLWPEIERIFRERLDEDA